MLISLKDLSKKELKALRKLATEESHAEVKRSLVQTLAQLPQQDLKDLTKELLFESDPKCQRLGRYYHGLLFDSDRGKNQLDSVFQDFREDVLIDRLYEVEVLSKAKDQEMHANVLGRLRKVSGRLRRPILRRRVKLIIARIKQELEHS